VAKGRRKAKRFQDKSEFDEIEAARKFIFSSKDLKKSKTIRTAFPGGQHKNEEGDEEEEEDVSVQSDDFSDDLKMNQSMDEDDINGATNDPAT